jgi:phosphatidylethanolamine-binding protein (PEBP) family uncharacterized protein
VRQPHGHTYDRRVAPVWFGVAAGALLLVVALIWRPSALGRTILLVLGGAALVAAAGGFVVAEARYDQCEEDRAVSAHGDLITCHRTVTGSTRTGGELARRPVPNAPPGREITLESPAFGFAAMLPRSTGCLGANEPPPLRWHRLPAGTKAQAIVLAEEARPEVVRWIVTDLPPGLRRLEGDGADLGRLLPNSLGVRGYSGPCAPPGEDLAVAFTFHVYALDRPLRLAGNTSLDEAFDAINAATVAEGELSGGYDPR